MNPFIRWAGSKRKLLPDLREYWETSGKVNRYIEPFAGSACFFFFLEPNAAILGDTNRGLIEMLETVRDQPVRVHEQLMQFPLGKDSFYAVRDASIDTPDRCIRAARFIYLNRFCFNGIYRTNNAGKFNVPYGGGATGDVPTLHELLSAREALRGAKLVVGDFEKTLACADEGDFVYMDPPYSVSNRRVFKQYGPSVFGLNDMHRLAAQLVQLDEKGAKFVLSYACCPQAMQLFSGWNLRRRLTNRNIAGFSTHRRQAVELMFSNIAL